MTQFINDRHVIPCLTHIARGSFLGILRTTRQTKEMPLNFIFILNSSTSVCEFRRQCLHAFVHYLKPHSTHFQPPCDRCIHLNFFLIRYAITENMKNFLLSQFFSVSAGNCINLLLEMSLDFNQCSLHIARIPSNYQQSPQLHRIK